MQVVQLLSEIHVEQIEEQLLQMLFNKYEPE